MKHFRLLAGASLALTSVLAIAQDAPESLLPPGFDQPAPKQAPAAKPADERPSSADATPASRAAATGSSGPVVQAIPAGGSQEDRAGSGASTGASAAGEAIKLPSLAELERMSPEQLEEVLGLKPKTDMPAAARRAMSQVGVLGVDEGGLPSGSLAGQNASLVRATLAGNNGQLVSRWGHILLRRALASRLDAPAGMNPADFTALRAALLVRMGEGEAARALVQDVDTANYTPALTQAALDAYVFTADFTGICPAVTIHGGTRTDPQWEVARIICAAFQGEGAAAMSRLDRAQYRGVMPRVDMMLARKYAGAAGKARRAVTIDWEGVNDMTPWRYGLTLAVGLQPPENLTRDGPAQYDYMAATAPMLGLAERANAADRAAGAGILSSTAMVDLYGQIHANDDITGEWSERAASLREAYVGANPTARLTAMQQLWNGAADADRRYSRMVLTAYAAARLPVTQDLADNAFDAIASMLAAGLDRNAARWSSVVEAGSEAWALLAVASPAIVKAQASGVETFRDNDNSEAGRRSAFLLAGLAGLGRLDEATVNDLADGMAIDLKSQTRWSRLIDQAAEVDNQALVALLAGVGMQGAGWNKMTPRHLYHTVSALRRVGLEAEARMIAAEAVARG